MDGPRGYYAKKNKSNLERQVLYDFTYMWNLKAKQMKKCNRTVIHTENKCGCQRGRAQGMSEIGEGDKLPVTKKKKKKRVTGIKCKDGEIQSIILQQLCWVIW